MCWASLKRTDKAMTELLKKKLAVKPKLKPTPSAKRKTRSAKSRRKTSAASRRRRKSANVRSRRRSADSSKSRRHELPRTKRRRSLGLKKRQSSCSRKMLARKKSPNRMNPLRCTRSSIGMAVMLVSSCSRQRN